MDLGSKFMSQRFVLTGPRIAEWVEYEHLIETEKDIVCKTLCSAISSGTELAAFQGAKSLSGGAIYPRVNGYMNVAEVLDVCDGVTTVQPGDVVLTFNCHESHFVARDDAVLVKLDDRSKIKKFVFAYAYHLGYSALLKSLLPIGAKVAVIGQGLLGQASAELLSTNGYFVTAISDYPASMEHLKKFSNAFLSSRNDNFSSAFDLAIVTTGSWHDYQLSMRIAGQNGIISILGFPGRDETLPTFNPFDAREFYTKQLSIHASGMLPECADSRGFNRFNERANLEFICHLIDSGSLDPSRFESFSDEYSNLEDVYIQLEDRKDNEISAVISW